MTQYVVLKRESEGWTPLRNSEARSAKAALTAVIDGKPGEYVAIPLRSWKPLKVEVETKTALKFS